MEDKIIIRKIKKSEITLLDHFLYEAIFIPEGEEKPTREIIKLPELSRYIKDFRKATDLCFVAECNGRLVGAIWTRVFTESEKGFGYVDSKTPELSISVNEKYRKNGIGAKLLTEMMDALKQHDYKQVSLSVDTLNYAYPWYRKSGFETVETVGESVTLIKRLNE